MKIGIWLTALGVAFLSATSLDARIIYPVSSAPSQTLTAHHGDWFRVISSNGGDYDSDGIPDDIDADDDNDAIDDVLEGLGDNDGDGIANCLDLDSDNDGITDLIEGAPSQELLSQLDADGDGILDASVFLGANGLADIAETQPDSAQGITGLSDGDFDGIVDQLDLDSDNDGLPDLIEIGLLDVDRSGRLDSFVDENQDGLSDVFSQNPANVRDTDNDGVFDFRDIDSDGDGLTDRLESSFQDTDNDGRVDEFADSNGDGLYDAYSAEFSMFDSDGDGLPNHIDEDSDNDGVPDSEEGFGGEDGSTSDGGNTDGNGTDGSGTDGNGTDGNGTDGNGTDGNGTDGSGTDGNGTDGSGTDGNGTDGNGTDGNGTDGTGTDGTGTDGTGTDGTGTDGSGSDSAGSEDPIEVGRSGSAFGCSISGAQSAPLDLSFFLLFIFAFLAVRQPLYRARRLVLLSFAFVLTSCASSQPNNVIGSPTFHVGASVGVGIFDIDAGPSTGAITSSEGTSKQLTLGLSLNPSVDIEGRFSDLGEATFEGDRYLGYQVADFSGKYRVSSNKFSGFLRAGAGALFNGGDINFVRENDYHFLIGLGLEYAITKNWAMRAEWTGHDVDVSNAGLGIFYRFGQRLPGPPVLIAQKEPKPEIKTTETIEDSVAIRASEPVRIESVRNPVADAEAKIPTAPVEVIVAEVPTKKPPTVAQKLPADTLDKLRKKVKPDAVKTDEVKTETSEALPTKQKIPAQDTDADGYIDVSDQCPQTPKGAIVDKLGCTLIGGIVDSIAFVENSDKFVASSDAALSQLVQVLRNDPQMRLVVAAHTQPGGDEKLNLLLSRKRTLAVIRYLQQQGIDSTRVLARAFGDTQPLSDPRSIEDHERIELSVQ